MRILIAVPTFETITPDTFKSIWDLDKGGHEVAFDFVRGYDCATARNNIDQKAMDMGVDYVLMVDNDVYLHRDALVNLLDGGDDVCLGYCASRNNANVYDGKTNIYRLGEFNYSMNYPGIEIKAMRERGEYKIHIHGGGMACALIRTDVFRQLPYPWFDWVNYGNGDVLSEDLFFCEECRKAGIVIKADTRVTCGHLFRRMQWTE